MNAERTVHATWDQLVDQGVSPIVLHVARSRASISVYILTEGILQAGMCLVAMLFLLHNSDTL